MTHSYSSNATLDDVAQRILAASRIVLTTHVKPDGDAIGSTIGLARALERLGKTAEVWYLPPLMAVFKQVINPTVIRMAAEHIQPPDDIDLIVILDTGAMSQLEGLQSWLERHNDRICIVDHHVQGDESVGSMRVIDPDCSAASEMAANLIRLLGVPFDAAIAEPLYMGIATDTGWFRFSNARSTTFRLAADLIEAGVDHAAMYRTIEQTDQPSRLRLLARALTSMEFINHDRVAVLTLRQEDYEECGATQDDSHGFSDMPLSVGTVEVVCVIAESKKGIVKLSMRSKPGPKAIDVNQVARQFNGGGHIRASGAKIAGDLDAVRAKVIEALRTV